MMSDPSRRVVLGLAAGASASVYAAPGVAAVNNERRDPPLSDDIHALVERERRTISDVMARQGVEGVAVCLIHDGQPLWIEGFGVTDRSSAGRVGQDTIFSIQSTSKNVTAVAILIAVQRGLLDLDAPITTYLPGFTVDTRFAPEPQDRVTLRLLLSHRAGFTHEAPVGNNYNPSFPSFEAHVQSISQTWLRYPVGDRYRYSNLGYDLAGYILQVRSGIPFPEWVRRELFAPLGMMDSTFATDEYVARRNRAVGHVAGYASVPLRTPLIPSGGLYTSARDFSVYSQFHLARGRAGGRQVLAESLWREMHGFALGGDYGLGVIRSERRYGETSIRLLSHKGGGFGFGSVFAYCPEAELAWAAFFNRPADDCYRFGEALVDGALACRFGVRRPRLPAEDLAPIRLTGRQQSGLVGRYVGRDSLVTITARDGGLIKNEDGVSAPISFLSPDEAFIVDPQGEVVSYRCVPADADLTAHLECSIGEKSVDYDDGPLAPEGQSGREWSAYVGSYNIDQWGKPGLKFVISQRHGFLYLNETRLVAEPEPHLFFTADGEAVDFRSQTPTWKNLVLHRTGK